MAFKSLRPIIWTKDLQKTTKFYKKLGFKIADQNEDWIWACRQCRRVVESSKK